MNKEISDEVLKILLQYTKQSVELEYLASMS